MRNNLKSALEATTNRAFYNKLIKKYRENVGDIRCSFCPYHKYENDTGSWEKKNWKQYRKTQYRRFVDMTITKPVGTPVKEKKRRFKFLNLIFRFFEK